MTKIYCDNTNGMKPYGMFGHRPDGFNCANCANFVCAWHCVCGDDFKQYCPNCSPNFRFDQYPDNPSTERISLVINKACSILNCSTNELNSLFPYSSINMEDMMKTKFHRNDWYNLCKFVRDNNESKKETN